MNLKATLISISAILLVLSALFIVSCSESEKDAKRAERDAGLQTKAVEWKRFKDPYFGFQFDYPGNWGVELADAHRFAGDGIGDVANLYNLRYLCCMVRQARLRNIGDVID